MKHAERDGLYLLLIGCAVFVLLGAALEVISTVSMTDFRAYYYSARCLIQKRDPYNVNEALRVYRSEEKERPHDTAENQQVITRFIYLPPTFVITSPLATLSFSVGRLIWVVLNAGCLILASFAIWDLASPYAPLMAGALTGFVVANSELVLITGNSVGIAIGLCVVSVWCIVKDRYVYPGILCLSISLMLKPHDAGFIWLYLVLAGGIYRRRAWQILAATTLLSLPALAWVTIVAPNWLHELRANIAALSVHGGVADPGPASSGAHALAMQINLQTALSVFWDDPRFYDPASYVLCGILVIVWSIRVLRRKSSERLSWIALAFAATLSMLPVYHRQDDAKLLLLTIPACAMAWARGGRIGKMMFVVTASGLVVTAEIPWAILLTGLRNLHLPSTPWARWGLIGVQVFPIPLVLAGMGIFYLWLLSRADEGAVLGGARE